MATRTDIQEPIPEPERKGPPIRSIGPRQWLRDNLFNSTANSILSLVVGLLLGWVIWKTLRFILVTGRWEVVRRNLLLLMAGQFPRDEIMRIWAALGVLAATIGLWTGLAAKALRQPSDAASGSSRAAALKTLWPWLLFGAVIGSMLRTPGPLIGALIVCVAGASVHAVARRLSRTLARLSTPIAAAGFVGALWTIVGRDGVVWDRWGGLLLTMFLAIGGIVLSFPAGLLLGLGRRSSLPAVRWVCVLYIELIRGVPLVTLLFMAAFALGFFLPRGMSTPSLVMRAMVAIVVFTAAYIAEVVRGGLQSVPRGQVEAAMALGMSPFATTRRIVLPQALRNVIPAMVGQFISLFKDTSLAYIIGLLELLRTAEIITTQPDFIAQGLQTETLVFASFVYWTGAYSMSKASQRLEQRLGVGHR